jgi:hypothetical protein
MDFLGNGFPVITKKYIWRGEDYHRIQTAKINRWLQICHLLMKAHGGRIISAR